MRAAARARAIERFYDNRLFEGVDAEIIQRIAPKIGVLEVKRNLGKERGCDGGSSTRDRSRAHVGAGAPA